MHALALIACTFDLSTFQRPLSYADVKLNDCKEIYNSGLTTSGVYTVAPEGQIQVFCDMSLDVSGKRGWLVIQRRISSASDFNQTRSMYENGFGRLDNGNLWLGLNKIKSIIDRTSNGVELYLGMGDYSTPTQGSAYALWNSFSIGTPSNDWTLSISTASADFTSSGGLANSMSVSNEKKFSTYDDDNDGVGGVNCAANYAGGWWFSSTTSCLEANMNGKYYTSYNNAAGGPRTGIVYEGWLGDGYSLKEVVMAIRPK